MCPSERFHSETSLWDPKATRDSGEMSAVYGNLFAAAAMYATVVDACSIAVEDFIRGGPKRDRVVAEDHLDSPSHHTRKDWSEIVIHSVQSSYNPTSQLH